MDFVCDKQVDRWVKLRVRGRVTRHDALPTGRSTDYESTISGSGPHLQKTHNIELDVVVYIDVKVQVVVSSSIDNIEHSNYIEDHCSSASRRSASSPIVRPTVPRRSVSVMKKRA